MSNRPSALPTIIGRAFRKERSREEAIEAENEARWRAVQSEAERLKERVESVEAEHVKLSGRLEAVETKGTTDGR